MDVTWGGCLWYRKSNLSDPGGFESVVITAALRTVKFRERLAQLLYFAKYSPLPAPELSFTSSVAVTAGNRNLVEVLDDEKVAPTSVSPFGPQGSQS